MDKRKEQRDKQRSTKQTHKTKDDTNSTKDRGMNSGTPEGSGMQFICTIFTERSTLSCFTSHTEN